MVHVVDAEVAAAAGRHAGYAFLSAALSYPGEESRRRVSEHVVPVLAALRCEDPELQARIDAARAAWDRPLGELRRAHGLLFTHIEPEDCPPYESAYASSDIFRQAHVMADVAGFYRAHGLRVGGRERERPDHITTELEFMAFMAAKEEHALAHLGADEVAECRRTQDHFLRDHLGTWAPSFARRVALVAEDPLHVAAARMLESWLLADLDAAGVEPVRVLDEPQPRPEPDDDACGAAEACGFEETPVSVPVELRGRR